MIGVYYFKRKGPPGNQRATDEELIELARKYGTDREGLERIARELGYAAYQSIYKRVKRLMNEA